MAELSILHVDMDAFYVEVERQDDPSLVGKPVIVGGDSERGVVASASYEARSRGVRSAMSSVVAKNLCPDAVFVRSNFSRYQEISQQVRQILYAVTPQLEPIALDEAFLDVSGAHRLFGGSEEIAWQIRSDVYEGVGLDCSVGVASSKLLAKLASVAAKPKASPDGVKPGVGVFVVHPDLATNFLEAHPVEALWGVGTATLKKLKALGISSVGDLASVPKELLIEELGTSHGNHLSKLSHGIDLREVDSERERKSISHEETFASDIYERAALTSQIVRLSDAVSARAREQGLAGRTIHLKMRRPDMSYVTRSVTLEEAVDTLPEIAGKATELLGELDVEQGVRLLGVGLSRLGLPGPQQLTLAGVEDNDSGWGKLSAAMDGIRQRYGHSAIRPGFPKPQTEDNG
ncbi:MAG: DNA polymerase IV [Candidatus Poriferisodalaceae bacterium]|nr:MAG: DNA polymerase IV [Acidimicrobiales bacterium MED-G01]